MDKIPERKEEKIKGKDGRKPKTHNGYILVDKIEQPESIDTDWSSTDDFVEDATMWGELIQQVNIDGDRLKAGTKILFLRQRAISFDLNDVRVIGVPESEVVLSL